MKKLYYSLLILLFPFSLFAQSIPWAYAVGGNGWDDVKATHLSNDFGFYVAGMHSGTLNVGPSTLSSAGFQDGLLAKMDTLGNPQWAVGIRGSDQEWVYDVCSDGQNNVYVCGYFQSPVVYFTPTDSLVKNALSSRNVFVAKYNSNGVFQWARLGDGGNTNCYATAYTLTCDNANNVIVSGNYNKTLYFGATALPATNATNIFMVKFDGSGNLVWAKAGVTSSSTWLNDMKTDAQNNIYVTGKISTAITFGATTIPNVQGDDMVTGKFDAQGNLLWMQVKGKAILASTTANNHESGNALVLDAQGNVFAGGCLLDTVYYDNVNNVLVVRQYAALLKYNNNGTLQWTKQYGVSEADNINGLGIDAQGDVYAIGSFRDTLQFGPSTLISNNVAQAFVAKFEGTNGNVVFAEQHGSSPAETSGIGIQVNPQTGHLYTCGNYRANMTFTPQTLSPIGIGDIFVCQRNNLVQPNSVLTESLSSTLKLYPMPVKNSLEIMFKEDILGASLVTMQGAQLSLDVKPKTIYFPEFAAGTYGLIMHFPSGIIQKTIVIKP